MMGYLNDALHEVLLSYGVPAAHHLLYHLGKDVLQKKIRLMMATVMITDTNCELYELFFLYCVTANNLADLGNY